MTGGDDQLFESVFFMDFGEVLEGAQDGDAMYFQPVFFMVVIDKTDGFPIPMSVLLEDLTQDQFPSFSSAVDQHRDIPDLRMAQGKQRDPDHLERKAREGHRDEKQNAVDRENGARKILEAINENNRQHRHQNGQGGS